MEAKRKPGGRVSSGRSARWPWPCAQAAAAAAAGARGPGGAGGTRPDPRRRPRAPVRPPRGSPHGPPCAAERETARQLEGRAGPGRRGGGDGGRAPGASGGAGLGRARRGRGRPRRPARPPGARHLSKRASVEILQIGCLLFSNIFWNSLQNFLTSNKWQTELMRRYEINRMTFQFKWGESKRYFFFNNIFVKMCRGSKILSCSKYIIWGGGTSSTHFIHFSTRRSKTFKRQKHKARRGWEGSGLSPALLFFSSPP